MMTESVSAVTAALIGAGGAVVGGVLTAGSNIALEGKRHKRDKLDREALERREVRRAARLVKAELDRCETALTTAKAADAWVLSPSDVLPVDCWETYRAVLASHLSQVEFDLTAKAYVIISVLRLGLPKTMTMPAGADLAIDSVIKAVVALEDYTAD